MKIEKVKYKEENEKTKLILKLVTALILILMIFSLFNTVLAYNVGDKIIVKEGSKVPTLMKFGEMYILCSLAEVYKDNNKYFAYCLEAKKDGVEVLGDYNLKITGKMTNNKVFSALMHGYPYKTPKQLGVNNAGEAFLATKQALYTMLYNRSVTDYSPVDSEAGRRTYAAYKKIVANAKKYPYKYIAPKINIEEISEWILTEDNKFLEKSFKVNSNIEKGKYNIFLSNNNIDAEIITTSKNSSNLDIKEEFKLKVPIEKLDQIGSLDIKANSTIESDIVYEATPNISSAQKLAIIGVKHEKNIEAKINVEYLRNETSLEILKKDKKSNKVLEGVEFNIYNEEKELIYENIKTDKEGKILLEGILPGKYFVKEIKTLKGYILNNEEIEIDIEYNNKTEIVIENIKKEIPKKILPKTGL